ncbi:hypothetical protein LTS17_001710 [Exophiala oligosperma]
MSSSQISASWNLQQSSESILSFAQGMLTAATSDNIQPLAILVAEAFGNTLAICQQTQMLVEKEASKRHVSHVVKFLHAKIGYAANDSASQLSLTSAGVRFMSLVAALLCTEDTLVAARAIEMMINATSRSDQLMPTVFQIRDLMNALEYKLRRLQFAESVAGWENYISTHSTWPKESASFFSQRQHPTPEGLTAIVDAFRAVERVGEASHIVIKSPIYHAWIIAFTKWCLGYPPHVIAEDGGVLVAQYPSKVTMMVQESDYGIAIEVFRELLSPSVLWSGSLDLFSQQHLWNGLISVKAYGARRSRSYGLHAELGHAALVQALLYSTKIATKNVIIGRDLRHQTPDEYKQFDVALWPSDLDILSTIATFCGLEEPPSEFPRDLSVPLFSLPAVSAFEGWLLKECDYPACSQHNPPKMHPEHAKCENIINFRDAIVAMTMDILAIALFDFGEEEIRVLAYPRLRSQSSFSSAVASITYNPNDLERPVESETKLEAQDVFDRALQLVGHKILPRTTYRGKNFHERYSVTEVKYQQDWVASGDMGQVVYPAQFDSWNDPVDSLPLLKLIVGPGSILYRGRRYQLVKSETSRSYTTIPGHHNTLCQTPMNLVPYAKLGWQVKEEDGYLSLHMELSRPFNRFSPMRALETACASLFISSCAHMAESPLPDQQPYREAKFVTPYYNGSMVNPHARGEPRLFAWIVAVAGDESLRFFALAAGEPAVVRGSACLKCCVDLYLRNTDRCTHIIC